MAESVDALVSGTSKRKFVQVRVLFRAPEPESPENNGGSGFLAVSYFIPSVRQYPQPHQFSTPVRAVVMQCSVSY